MLNRLPRPMTWDDDNDPLHHTSFIFYLDLDGDGYGSNNDSTEACSQPLGYITINGDCNDDDSQINSGVVEICNGIDDDCDGQADEGFSPVIYYQDLDGDNYGSIVSIVACSQPSGYVLTPGDCDDNNFHVWPNSSETCNGVDDNCNGQVDEGVVITTYYFDNDGDNYGSSPTIQTCFAPPPGYVITGGDCDDNNFNVWPNNAEYCNGIDDNCNGQIDEGFSPSTYYLDIDGDGFGNPLISIISCSPIAGFTIISGDCDDNDPLHHISFTFYRDLDGDGYGSTTDSTQACSQPFGYVAVSGDCDDNNPLINSGTTETCNGVDDNCDGQTDEGFSPTIYYQDLDGDNYGNTSVSITACSQPIGFVNTPGDCDDNNPHIWPNSSETCNGIDDNCNGQIDEGVVITTWYFDNDGDNYGSTPTLQSCTQPLGYVITPGDCDDNNNHVWPNSSEICNGIDDNCNGTIDEGCFATLNLKVFIEGFYSGPNIMQAVKFNAGISFDQTICDEITVQLHDQLAPETIVASQTAMLDVNGNATVQFPANVSGATYYIAILTRNGIETWSKLPVTFGVVTAFDLTH